MYVSHDHDDQLSMKTHQNGVSLHFLLEHSISSHPRGGLVSSQYPTHTTSHVQIIQLFYLGLGGVQERKEVRALNVGGTNNLHYEHSY